MEPANCKCSNKGRNLVVCIDGTSNQFGEQNTNVVELYSKIVKTEGSKQLTYYNSGIGTYVKPSWISLNYLLQVVDNSVDLAIAWNFEKIIIGAYRWLSDNYQENDRIFLFGFSRGAYQVRALAGMIQRVGLIYKGNEEQIPFAYELYATHTTTLTTRFKETFSRENVQVHFVGVWDTVSSVGIVRGKSLPLTDSADHVCFFRHALALDERRVKFLPEYVHGGVCKEPTEPERPKDEAEIQEIGLNLAPRIKEVWFPGTHSDIGGGNQLNRDLDLGRSSFLWMSFEAVSCGLQLRPTRVEWRWDRLHEVEESLTGVWHMFEWIPFKILSYQDESSTVYDFHQGRGRMIKPGQKVHSSVAFCDESYHPKAILPQPGGLYELVGKGLLSNRDWVKGWEDLIEMDIFDLSLLSNVIEMLKSGTGAEGHMWAYRLTAMMSTDEGQNTLRNRPNVVNDLIQIFTRADHQEEVQECVMAILENTSKGHASVLLSPEHCIWLLRIAREKSMIDFRLRSFAVKLLVHSLSKEQSCEEILDENALDALVEMARDEQQDWVTDGAFAMFTTLLSQNTLAQKLFAANTLSSVRKRFTADDSYSQDVAKRLFGMILKSDKNRQYIFDNDVLHYFLTKIDNLDDTKRILFTNFLQKHYEYLPNEFFTLLTSKLCVKSNDPQRHNIWLVLRDTFHSDGLRRRMWNSDIVKALRQALINHVFLPIRSLALGLYKESMIHKRLGDDLFDRDTVRDLWNGIYDSDNGFAGITVDFFVAALGQGSIRNKIFDTEILAALRLAAIDERSMVTFNARKVLTAAIAQEGVRDKIFDTETVAALGRALCDGSSSVRASAVTLFTNAIAQEGFRDKIFDNETIAMFRRALDDKTHDSRKSMVDIFTPVIAQEGFRDKIFDTEIVAALGRALGDESPHIRIIVAMLFTDAITQGVFQEKTFDNETIAIFRRGLGDESPQVRYRTSNIFIAVIAQEGLRDRIFDNETIAIFRRTLGDKDSDATINTVEIFKAAIAQEGFRDKIFDNETVAALRCVEGDEDYNLSWVEIDLYEAAIAQEGFRDKIFDTEIFAALGRALGDESGNVRSYAVSFFTVAMAQEGCRDKIFDTETLAALGRALGDESGNVRSWAVEFFTAAMDQEGFRDKIFDTETFAALRRALGDESRKIRYRVVELFTAAMAEEGFRDKIFDTENLAALVRALDDEDAYYVRDRTVEFFTAAIVQEGFRDRIFDTETVAALRNVKCDNHDFSSTVTRLYEAAMAQEVFRDKIFDNEAIAMFRRALVNGRYASDVAVNVFIAAIAQEGFRDKIFDNETIATLRRALGGKNSDARVCAVEIFTAAIAQEGFRDKIFDTETLATLGHALGDEDSNVRKGAVEIFTVAIDQEGFRDKIFDTETLAALGRALGDESSVVRNGVFKIFTVAITQEGFRDKIFDILTVAPGPLIEAQLEVDTVVQFWSHDYVLSRAYNHFITFTLCEQLTSADLSLRDQTRCFVSEAIKYDDIHTRICTPELRKHIHCPHHVSST